MANFSKFSDIEAVMNKANSSLPTIEREYLKYLHEEKMPDDFLVDIKDYLANLRTALDYLWYKIPNTKGGYFPIANSEKDFLTKVTDIDPKYKESFRNVQSYDPNSWIRRFNLFRNKNSHVTLIPQKRAETREFSVKKNGAGITSIGCSFQGNISFVVGGTAVPIDERTQFPVDAAGVDIQRIIWVDFLFDGSSISSDFPAGVSALPFLKESLKKVTEIVVAIEKEL